MVWILKAKDQQPKRHVLGLEPCATDDSEYASGSHHGMADGLLWHVLHTTACRAGTPKMGKCAADDILVARTVEYQASDILDVATGCEFRMKEHKQSNDNNRAELLRVPLPRELDKSSLTTSKGQVSCGGSGGFEG